MSYVYSITTYFRPRSVLELQAHRHPIHREQSPDQPPNERRDPADTVGVIDVQRPHQSGCAQGGNDSSQTPEQRESAQHVAEAVAAPIPQAQALPKLCSATAVGSDDILDDGVDARAESGAGRAGGDAERRRGLAQVQEIAQEDISGEDEEHAGRGHGEQALDGVAVGVADDELGDGGEDGEQEDPVRVVEVGARRALGSAARGRFPEMVAAEEEFEDERAAGQCGGDAEDGGVGQARREAE